MISSLFSAKWRVDFELLDSLGPVWRVTSECDPLMRLRERGEP